VTQEYIKAEKPETENAELTALMHRTIKKVTIDIHRLSFNTAIATLMEYVNELYKMKTSGFSTAWRQPIEALAQLLGVFAPHMAAELWQQLSRGDQLDFAQWPEWNDSLTVAETVTIIVQVNGKLRAKLQVAKDISEDEVKSMSLAEENVQKFVTGEPKKVIYVPGKLVSIVV
jgi:leucyl-tRNA synthetase